VDGQLRPQERETFRQLLEREPYGEIALYALDWKKRGGEVTDVAYQLGCQRFSANKVCLSPGLTAHFLDILRRVAEADGSISPHENDLLRRFGEDLDRQ
jgi:uncharacterized tellurite resistance protein B-like protein